MSFDRRSFLQTSALGSLALQELLSPARAAAGTRSKQVTSGGKARNVLFIHLVGAPSQLDLYDYKPVLQKYDRQLAPKEFFEGKRFAFLTGHPKLLGTRYQFQRHGQSGAFLSELLPHLGSVADDLTFVRSMHTTEFNHAPAQLFFHTGRNRQGQPSLGSWIDYGLGSLNQNLPSYVVFVSGGLPGAGANLWGNGFLPSEHQATEFRSAGEPVLFLNSPAGIDPDRRRRLLDQLGRMNSLHHTESQDPDILARIKQYEMAFRMQSSVPEVMDLSKEPETVRAAYGPGDFALQCLHARRLLESGVRFVEIFHRDWDTHGGMHRALGRLCKSVDQPLAALLRDLKTRGLLSETLVVCAGEFGRTPMLQGNESPEACGRDHHKDAFTIWMAGGGTKPGLQYGATDELGYHVAENPVHVRDLHATLLHLLGIDHKKLTFRYQGLDQRLTGVEETRVIHELLA